ncbi:alpha/beta fold hydrolase [Spirosoma sp. HMF4905]|uniref:Alpha/beta fold hydrolase n=1 Tax=Spirosoma arboris TaxID=2682092 RepID=A0A7K1SJN3_9BACT|nr:alpha/beta hydrolase [Spirosoma arboris]MVM33954.1 alpha/beta fold hydrolase [Spirosoma arboris]
MVRLIGKLVKWIGIVLLTLLAGSSLFEYYTRWKLEQTLLDGKTFVEIDGHLVHYVQKGQGPCTVVFVCGLGSDHTMWQPIQDSVAKQAVTISYDCSGLFLSEASQRPITNETVSTELAQLLEKTACPKPYIMIAHSMGGIYMRPFIQQHRDDISGIVLAESAHPLQLKKASPELLKTLGAPPRWLVKLLVNTGIYRILFTFVPLSNELPIDQWFNRNARDYFYRSVNTLFDEVANDDRNFADAEQYTSFGTIPLTVITGTSSIRTQGFPRKEGQEYRQIVATLHRDLLNLSTNSRLVKASQSGHMIQAEQPDLVTAEIQALINLLPNPQ